MAQHNDLGKKGEQIAVDAYKIVARNYRYLQGEVDIIAIKNNNLIAVEVKTRSSIDFGNPQEFIKPQQIKRIVTTLDNFINENNIELEVRFDIIAILKQKDTFQVEHLKDAFLHF